MARASTTRDARERASSSASAAALGPSLRIRGKVTGDGDLRIEGRVEGDVVVSGDLAIEEGGGVVGEITAGSVSVAGELTGDVASRGPVTIRASARVAGHMGGSEVSLEEGASFVGRIEAEFDLPPELSQRR